MPVRHQHSPPPVADPLANLIVPIVTVTVIDQRGRLLLFKREKPGQLFENHWEVVGGRIEFGETSAEAAQRELWEEAGISAKPEFVTVLEHVGRRSVVVPASYHRIMFVYVAVVDNPKVVKTEHHHYRWLPVDNLPGKIIPFNREAIYYTLVHIKQHPKGQLPLFAEYAFSRRLTLLKPAAENEDLGDEHEQLSLLA